MIAGILLAMSLICFAGCGSDKPPKVSVPNIVGMTEALAQTAITGAKLAVGTITYANSDIVPAGNVISQNPLSGTSVNEGTKVAFVLSSGPVIPPVDNLYEVPAGISIDFYEGASKACPSITANELEKIQQVIVHMVTSNSSGRIDDRHYVAYAISDVLDYIDCKLSKFGNIKYHATDGFGDADPPLAKTGFARAYIAIGYYETDPDPAKLSQSGAPRVITDSAAETSNTIVQRIDRITVTPVSNSYQVPATIEIDVYNNTTKKATITAANLEEIQQEIVHMVTSNSRGTIDDRYYVAYAIQGVLDYLKCELSPFTTIKYHASDGYGDADPPLDKTSFARAYIAIGYYETDPDPAKLNQGGAPRVITDSDAVTSDKIIQRVDRITVTP